MKRVDINVDIGEGFPHDEALLEFATSANVCCGEHAGSWELTLETIALSQRKEVRIGCHPGYPDREGLGRRAPIGEESIAWHDALGVQVERFQAFATASYVKPHGAWYNAIGQAQPEALEALRTICKQSGLQPMLLAGWQSELHPISEGFADRRYRESMLVPRSDPDAMLEGPSEIAEQVLRLAPRVDSICVHGDAPNSLHVVELVRRTLVDGGYEVGT